MNLDQQRKTPSVRDWYAAELAWLDCLIEREILRLRTRYELSLDELRGLYISDRQVDELLRQSPTGESSPGIIERQTDEALSLRDARRDDTPLGELARRLCLLPAEADLLLLALAPELDLKYETLYAYLNNDVTRKYLTGDLTLRLLSNAAEPAERSTVSASSRLFETGLVESIDHGEHRSKLAQGIALSPPAIDFLLGLPVTDPRLPSGVKVLPAAQSETDMEALSTSAQSTVATFANRQPVRPGLIVCTGESPVEQLAAGRMYAAHHGHTVVALPLTTLAPESSWPRMCKQLHTTALLTRALAVVFDEASEFPREPAPLRKLIRQVRELAERMPLIWAVPEDAPWRPAVVDLPFAELTLPKPSNQERADTWHTALAQQGLEADPETVEIISERFNLPCSRIVAAAQTASRLADENSEDSLRSVLWHAARRHSEQSLAELATRIVKPHTWQQLVLPETTLNQVKELAAAITQRDRVFVRWGMAERTGRGHGLMALFTGASGTGKTMTAAVIANDLGLELYRIDLASIVSKYIGETEKNLDRIFHAARRSNAILFFDEADALLGKRSEVKDAHDRYANIEVAFLLQNMEEHDGVVILASNLAKNLDQAFARRMHYVVEFPRPDVQLREILWPGMFPRQAPLADDVDFPFLAAQFETSGGEIQTIALEAAFLASADGGVIGMAHIVKAMARHQLKQGSPASASGFRQYHTMVQRG